MWLIYQLLPIFDHKLVYVQAAARKDGPVLPSVCLQVLSLLLCICGDAKGSVMSQIKEWNLWKLIRQKIILIRFNFQIYLMQSYAAQEIL